MLIVLMNINIRKVFLFVCLFVCYLFVCLFVRSLDDVSKKKLKTFQKGKFCLQEYPCIVYCTFNRYINAFLSIFPYIYMAIEHRQIL